MSQGSNLKDGINLFCYQIGCVVSSPLINSTFELTSSVNTLNALNNVNHALFLKEINDYIYKYLDILSNVKEDIVKLKTMSKELKSLNFIDVDAHYYGIVRSARDALYQMGPNIAYYNVMKEDLFDFIENEWKDILSIFNEESNYFKMTVYNGKVVGALPNTVFEIEDELSLYKRAYNLTKTLKS